MALKPLQFIMLQVQEAAQRMSSRGFNEALSAKFNYTAQLSNVTFSPTVQLGQEHVADMGTDCKGCSLPAAVEACAEGTCVIAHCFPGWADCDGLHETGCEVNVANSTLHCGGCNMACSLTNAVEYSCANSTCEVARCREGLEECNRYAQDGCKADLSQSSDHCGACNHPCSLPNVVEHLCVDGSCTVGKCAGGFNNTNGDHLDGCELYLVSNDDPQPSISKGTHQR